LNIALLIVVVIVLCKWWKLLEIFVDKIFEVCYCNVIGHFWVFLPQSWQFEVDDTFGTLLSSTILVNLGGAIMFSWCDCLYLESYYRCFAPITFEPIIGFQFARQLHDM